MSVVQASERIKSLYRESSNDDQVWKSALDAFGFALNSENDAETLERCILDDNNWELPVQLRIDLLNKAKALGCRSRAFLMDYYGYKAAHLDPEDEERIQARKELEKLMAQ